MIAYHYTPRKFLPRIKEGGIKAGMVPWRIDSDGIIVSKMRGLQWLTLDNEFDTQSWIEPALYAPHRMRKNDYRLMIDIPMLAEHNVTRWDDFALQHKLPADLIAYFQTFPDSKWWVIYRGVIPANWVIDVTRNPTPYQAPELLEN